MNELHNPFETPRKSLELAKQLESTFEAEFIKKHLGELLESMEQDMAVHFQDEVDSLYEGMKNDNCLVRVEQLSRVLEAIELNSNYEIGHRGESHYANAVIPEERGFKLALAEGQAQGPIRTIVSFGKTIIGFKTDNLEVTEVDFVADTAGVRDEYERRYICRHVEGTITKDDIKYLVMRIPRHLLDEKHMNQEEREDVDAPFIFRGLKF
jgi:hypothetical protein